MRKLHAFLTWWPISLLGLVSMLTGWSGWGAARWALKEVPSFGRDFVAVVLANQEATRTVLVALGFLLLVVGTCGPWLLTAFRRKKAKRREEPAPIQPQPSDKRPLIEIVGGSRGNIISDSHVYSDRQFIRIDEGSDENQVLRTEFRGAPPGRPVRLTREELQELQLACANVSRQLAMFLHERAQREPELPNQPQDQEEIREMLEAYSAYAEETIDLYVLRFGNPVLQLGQIASAAEYRNAELMHHARRRPTYVWQLERIVGCLSEISERIGADLER
jgi:hypothetical protein